jgi:hypothetical protein
MSGMTSELTKISHVPKSRNIVLHLIKIAKFFQVAVVCEGRVVDRFKSVATRKVVTISDVSNSEYREMKDLRMSWELYLHGR